MSLSLAAVAFRVFGMKVTFKQILYAFLAIVVGVIIYLAYDKVRDHFQHIKDIEAENVQLGKDKAQLEKDLDAAVEINRKNAQTNKTASEQKAAATVIADTEVKAGTVRTTKTKERADAIRATPPTADPVAPVVRDTLNSLWGPEGGSEQRK